MQAYKKLEERFAKVTALDQIYSLLDWDRAVTMPGQGNDQRARQIGVISVLAHALQSDPEVAALAAAVDRAQLNDWQRANLRLIERLHVDSAAVPADLVERKAAQEARTEMLWREARAEGDFKKVLPGLEKLVDLTRACAEAKAARLGVSPYEALMDTYAPGMPMQEVDAIFDDYAAFMPALLDRALARQEPLPLKGPFPLAAQVDLSRKIAEGLGFDFSWGRLDVSAHPFSSGIGNDVRITTRYDENDFFPGLQGAAHETGHALYDHNTPAEWHGQPVGASQNMGMMMHESQSLSLDMQLFRGLPYWTFIAPAVCAAFGGSGPAWEAENLWRHASRVARGYIRIEADEVTYPAHIILRYRLERDLIGGKLQPRDIREAWNEGFKDLMGLEVPDDRLGCLQDIHWFTGYYGYFPAYALGAMTAAQFVRKMREDIPDLDARVARGDIAAFTGWLKTSVQEKACLHEPQDLIEKVTGRRLTAEAFKQHLAERYGDGTCSDTSAPGEKRRA